MAANFPDGFLWGASTAAYQIEGATREDGRGPSIWDIFCGLPGTIANGDSGTVACDHYHRWPEDVALMRELGLGAYRLSLAWPRILPEGRGAANAKGLEFYDRLVDGILDAGIEPWICLYHWDLPQALEYRGGWQNRDTAHWYAEYAQLAVRRLGDRVKHWATFNGPNCASLKGYGDGEHAPGIRGRASALAAIHAMNLAHGLGVAAMRAERADLLLGNIYNFRPHEPASEHEEDEIACEVLDALWNRSFPDPQMLGRYPEPLATEMVEPLVQPGDMELIRQKLDYFAFNHYTRSRVRRDPDHPFAVGTLPPEPGRPVTAMGWEIAPDAFRQVLIEAKERYSGDLPIYVLENGAAFPDQVEADGRIRDDDRIAYLRRYLGAVQDAIAAGVLVKGYFVWSLLDNFEWTFGYSRRFGLVHVDYATQQRRPKDSFHFYAELAHGAGLERE
ncbi:MAG TPA: GH1 family beta-glucosidase [Stellaceae bacterium]|nr:GH1 family beta-glucosidase [Stellaceae bacterium]